MPPSSKASFGTLRGLPQRRHKLIGELLFRQGGNQIASICEPVPASARIMLIHFSRVGGFSSEAVKRGAEWRDKMTRPPPPLLLWLCRRLGPRAAAMKIYGPFVRGIEWLPVNYAEFMNLILLMDFSIIFSSNYSK